MRVSGLKNASSSVMQGPPRLFPLFFQNGFIGVVMAIGAAVTTDATAGGDGRVPSS
jgi:hypothetical protein